ncbi:MAG: hypothetical protein PHT34_02240 [Oscillospiraceae bacterium]|nr:hypothetical protein [Oscillospiraceae bacterium]
MAIPLKKFHKNKNLKKSMAKRIKHYTIGRFVFQLLSAESVHPSFCTTSAQMTQATKKSLPQMLKQHPQTSSFLSKSF